jgi:hypothetical protein
MNTPDQHLPAEFAPEPVNADKIGRVVLADETQIPAEEQYQASMEAFGTQLERLGQHVPEAAEEAEAITRGGAQLVEAFGIRPEFFEDENRSTIFASLSLGAARTHDALGQVGANKAELERKRTFIASATFLLARDHSDNFRDQSADHEAQMSEGLDPITKAKMDKFEHPELTSSLGRYIESHGVLDELRAKLGHQSTEPDYHVLSIGKTSAFHFDAEANGLTYEEAREWDRGMDRRTEAFAASIPGGDLAAGAGGFAINFDDNPDHHHVYIPGPAAELVMADERGIVPNKYMVETGKAARTLGTIRHEFVHTQGNVNVEGGFGKSIEERRAEYFAGDTGEYYEVKSFFRHMQLLTGDYIGDMFDEALASTHTDNPVSIYELIGNKFGLETVAEVAAAQPHAYVMHAKSSYTKDMLHALGGYDTVVERAARSQYVDLDAARRRTARVINNFRADKLSDSGELSKDQEEFIGSYFEPVLRGLGLKLADIAYEPREEQTTKWPK